MLISKYFRMSRALRILCVSSALAGTVPLASAAIPDRFPASYQLTNVVENGGQVEVTFKLSLFNPTSSAFKGGVVVLLDSQPDHGLIGTLGTIKSLEGSSTENLTKTVTVSADEYANWRRGHEPLMRYLVSDGERSKAVPIQAQRILPSDAADNR